jgi:sulfite exporter TauE/SafE
MENKSGHAVPENGNPGILAYQHEQSKKDKGEGMANNDSADCMGSTAPVDSGGEINGEVQSHRETVYETREMQFERDKQRLQENLRKEIQKKKEMESAVPTVAASQAIHPNGIFDTISNNTIVKAVGWGAVFVGLYLVLSNFPIFASGNIDPRAGLALIFFTGVLTSLHCIGMCSGFVVSYASKTSSNDIAPHLCYNSGRILSYTVLGALLGLIGSVFAFNDQIRSYLAIFAGMFMIVFGLSMFFPQFRRFVTLPGLNLMQQNSKKSPVLIGILNGLMPCGPLQAMLIYAAGTGSAVEGALVMLAFGLGTVPLMLVLGGITSMAASSRVLIHKIVKFSGVLVMVLGLIMLGRGFALIGISVPVLTPNAVPTFQNQTSSLNASAENVQEITMYIDNSGWNPSVLTVKKGIPVRWTVIARQLTSCNSGLKVPKLGISKMFKNGETAVFEFTPNETGTIPFTCWMGMIPGRIEVIG